MPLSTTTTRGTSVRIELGALGGSAIKMFWNGGASSVVRNVGPTKTKQDSRCDRSSKTGQKQWLELFSFCRSGRREVFTFDIIDISKVSFKFRVFSKIVGKLSLQCQKSRYQNHGGPTKKFRYCRIKQFDVFIQIKHSRTIKTV